MEYQDFLTALQKRGSKAHKIKHCLGSRDAWKWVRKNKWKCLDKKSCDQQLYSKIINTVNKYLIEKLMEGHEIEFPHQMGTLEISSIPSKVVVEEENIKTNYRTDWKKTLHLWYADKEARDSHKTVKRIQKRIYFIKYSKRKARYANGRFYLFRANRSLVKKLGKAIEEGKVIAEAI